MVEEYDIAFAPARHSRHTEGHAVDMTISWASDLEQAHMPIQQTGWEILVTRLGLHLSGAKKRTYGTYQVFLNGQAVAGLSGHVCEMQPDALPHIFVETFAQNYEQAARGDNDGNTQHDAA